MPAMTLAFAVRRREPELVGPAAPTPLETKRLSDIDDQETLRGHVPFIFFYRGREQQPAGRRRPGGRPPPRTRRGAGAVLPSRRAAQGGGGAEAGGRLQRRGGDVRGGRRRRAAGGAGGGRAEAAVPVHGSAAVRRRRLRRRARLPIAAHPGETRLLCGGFVLGLRLNHTICDAIGLARFMSTAAELARGLPGPTSPPSWSRDLLEARSPPKSAFPHREYDVVPAPPPPPSGEMVTRTFTFGPVDIAAIKGHLPPRLRDTATTFEALTASLWRARTAALELPPEDEVRLVFIVNVRGVPEMGLPGDYYGNAAVPTGAVTTAGALLAGSLGDAVERVREAKAAVTAEYVRSTADLLVLRGRPAMAMPANLFVVSDNRHAGFHRVDFGWGVPVYGGASTANYGGSFLVAVKNGEGEDAVAVAFMLPPPAMDRLASEVEMLLNSVVSKADAKLLISG